MRDASRSFATGCPVVCVKARVRLPCCVIQCPRIPPCGLVPDVFWPEAAAQMQCRNVTSDMGRKLLSRCYTFDENAGEARIPGTIAVVVVGSTGLRWSRVIQPDSPNVSGRVW